MPQDAGVACLSGSPPSTIYSEGLPSRSPNVSERRDAIVERDRTTLVPFSIEAPFIGKVNDMKNRRRDFLKSSVAALALVLAAGLAQAAPKVLPPHSNAFGMGYDEHAAAWLEWITSIPNASSPLFDVDGSYGAVGQGGKVWFLAGNTGGTMTRTITVPVGKAMFFPVINYFWVNTPELGDEPWSPEQEAFARSVLASYMDTTQGLVLQIDGRTIPNVYEFLRVNSAVGTCMLPPPADNLFGANGGPHPCVADGFWALLPPMSAGKHTIRFAGQIPDAGFSLDLTYHVTVRRGH